MPPTLLTLTPPDAEWMAKAICHGRGTLMEAETPAAEKLAKAMCHACPVEDACARWTLSLPPREDVSGVAGGMTAKERELVRRRIRRGTMTGPEEPRACSRGKECVHGEVKQPAHEFYQRPRYPGGRERQCRTCCQKRYRANRAARKAAEAAEVAS
jgi:hypothetical protein